MYLALLGIIYLRLIYEMDCKDGESGESGQTTIAVVLARGNESLE